MRNTVSFVVTMAFALVICVTPQSAQVRNLRDDAQDWSEVRKRFQETYAGYLSSEGWALIHVSESKSEVDESLVLLQKLGIAIDKNDPTLLKDIGGFTGLKERYSKLMKSTDDTVSGFAASVLAITGDLNYAPQIASLLEKKDRPPSAKKYSLPVTVRGRAAVALGVLGSKEYTQRIAKLLQSKNEYDWSGAATALGFLGAKEYANDVAALLAKKELGFLDNDSLIFALVQMGVAENYKKEFALLLSEKFRENGKTAVYVLAHLRAKEYVKDIAALLKEEFRKGDAAKALAIMGATEVIPEIAIVLNDERTLNRKDALLALGILNAREYGPKVATFLNAEEDFIRYYAAVSLVLMEANEYAKELVPIIEKSHQSGAYLNDGDFHPLVGEEALEIKKRFTESLARMKFSQE